MAEAEGDVEEAAEAIEGVAEEATQMEVKEVAK